MTNLQHEILKREAQIALLRSFSYKHGYFKDKEGKVKQEGVITITDTTAQLNRLKQECHALNKKWKDTGEFNISDEWFNKLTNDN